MICDAYYARFGEFVHRRTAAAIEWFSGHVQSCALAIVLVVLVLETPIRAEGSGPILSIDFESDWLSTGAVADASGTGNIADCQRELNQCPQVSIGPDSSRAAHFSGFTYNPAKDSDYIAVQDSPRFKNMVTGTFSVWAKYSDGTSAGHFLDSWDYSQGTWRIGRYWRAKWPYEFRTTFIVAPERIGEAQDAYRIAFPDTGTQNQWNHYAVTWDGNRFKGYFNGTYFAQSKQTEKLTSNRYYLAVGAFGHYVARNTPDPANQTTFPNNGFLNGDLDDLKIYSRALSAAEIFQLFSKHAATASCGNGTVEPSEECDDANQLNGDGCSACAVEAGFSCGASPSTCLRYPTHLESTLSAPTTTPNQFRIVLHWNDNALGEDAYFVERRPPGGSWLQVASLPANTSSYEDTISVTNTQFYYRVRAKKQQTYSDYSEIIRVYPTPSPTQLQLQRLSPNKVLLQWQSTSPIPRTSIEFSVDGDVFVTIKDSVLSNSTEDSYSFQVGRAYYYRVCIFEEVSKSCSGYSNTISYRPTVAEADPGSPADLTMVGN